MKIEKSAIYCYSVIYNQKMFVAYRNKQKICKRHAKRPKILLTYAFLFLHIYPTELIRFDKALI